MYYGETYSGNATARSFTAPGFPPDLFVADTRTGTGDGAIWGDRLRGPNAALYSAYTQTESTTASVITGFGQNGASIGTDGSINGSGKTYVGWNMRRAPGFFDVVCYTGTAAAQTQSHNLGVAPELMIVKRRSAAASWAVYSSALGNTKSLELNSTGAVINSVNLWNSTTPTSSVFSIGGSDTSVNASGSTYVAYLFATVTGVSKVGTYVGNATVNGQSQIIDCGFTAGARFVMIKCTSTIGDWYVFDSRKVS